MRPKSAWNYLFITNLKHVAAIPIRKLASVWKMAAFFRGFLFLYVKFRLCHVLLLLFIYSKLEAFRVRWASSPQPLLFTLFPSVTAAIHCLIYFPSFIYLFLCSVFLPYLVVFLRYFSSFDEANLPTVNSEAFFRPGPHQFPTVHFTSQLAAPAAALVAAKADTVEGTNCCNPLGSERRPRRKGRRPPMSH